MPLVIRPRAGGSLRLVTASAALLTVACGAMGGSAQAAPASGSTTTTTSVTTPGCPVLPTSPVFAAFGDLAEYVLAPGGSFESGSAGWTLNGNTLAAANDPFKLNASTDVQAASIAPTTSVVSPEFCVDSTNPFLRLVGNKATKGSIKVELLYTDPTYGTPAVKTAGSLRMGGINQNGDYSKWAPSPILNLAAALPLAKAASGTLLVRVRLAADAEPGNWLVDDVFVDPFRAG